MTGFWLGAAALVGLMLWLLRPARPGPAADEAASMDNLSILRAEWARVEAGRASGELDADMHRAARDELQRRVLAEAPRAARPLRDGRPVASWLLASLAVVASAIALYARIGEPDAVGAASVPVAEAPEAEAAEAVAIMVDGLARRLETDAELARDPRAWAMLARTSASMRRFDEADAAYARALALTPDDAQLLADRADMLAMLQDGRMAGEPQRLIERALSLDADNLKALALAGSAAHERGDAAAARAFWQRARARAPAGSAFAAGIERSLAALGESPAGPAAAAVRLAGRASLAPSLAAHVEPGDTVYVTARAVDGPPMPLAVLRRRAADLPFDFALDSSMAMSPGATLADHAKVIVSVRVSRSGDAMPRSGDLLGQAPADTGAGGTVAVTIDRVQP